MTNFRIPETGFHCILHVNNSITPQCLISGPPNATNTEAPMSHSESLVILNYTCYLHLDNISQTQNRTSIRNHQQILFQPTNFYPIGHSIGKRLRAVCFLHAARHSSWTFLFAKQCFLFSDFSFSLSFVFTRLYYQTAQTLFPFQFRLHPQTSILFLPS